MNTRFLYPLLGAPSKPREPVPPSRFEEFHCSIEELLEKFIKEHDYVSRSDYDSNFITFLHSEEFFTWLAKLAAEDKISVKLEWEANDSVSDLDFYFKIDYDQYQVAEENYKKELEKYNKELATYNSRCLDVVKSNISALEEKLLDLKRQEKDLLNK